MTFDARIVDIEEGKGKYAGMMGAIFVEGNFEGKPISVRVGSGFDDQMRQKLFDKTNIGRMVEVQCQEITRAGSARFPVFVRMRPDRDAVIGI